ncbi:MAG TPA: 2-succinyl-6-hydroxy-2,4-cyclohexadiene-1-carboxylate synthase [Ignavibacteriales bacterium]|nr:2-succinyl-6-hydroxy-2,4-cyclohexadiene-1-carboxylate synthase [Ignavibacteriales bacterium]
MSINIPLRLMIIKLKDAELNVETPHSSSEGATPVVFLHGFTGSSRDWMFLFNRLPEGYSPYAIDIIGHGRSSSPADPSLYSAEAISNQILGVIHYFNLKEVILAGYSMGGRAALSFAVENPGLLKGLILESSTAGIIDENERRERASSDLRLAEFIENNPIEAFADYWMDVPLFATLKKLPENVYAEVKKKKMLNSKTGLANSLRGFSTGVMPQLWDKLKDINCRTMLITGELDKKFTGINIEMSRKIKLSEHEVIESAGHNTHLERPENFLNLLNRFLTGLTKAEG